MKLFFGFLLLGEDGRKQSPLLEHLQRCLVCDPLRKYFSHSSLVMYSFATPPIKLKLGQQIGGGGGDY